MFAITARVILGAALIAAIAIGAVILWESISPRTQGGALILFGGIAALKVWHTVEQALGRTRFAEHRSSTGESDHA